jgi:NADPH:quinone reductase-like Zn-dependent oxidoreductase
MTGPDEIRIVVVDQTDPGRLAVQSAPLAPAAPGELTVKVTAVSLNRGDVRRAPTTMETGARPGWDFVGVVEKAAGTNGPQPLVADEAPSTDIAVIAGQLLDRSFAGKAVLHVKG